MAQDQSLCSMVTRVRQVMCFIFEVSCRVWKESKNSLCFMFIFWKVESVVEALMKAVSYTKHMLSLEVSVHLSDLGQGGHTTDPHTHTLERKNCKHTVAWFTCILTKMFRIFKTVKTRTKEHAFFGTGWLCFHTSEAFCQISLKMFLISGNNILHPGLLTYEVNAQLLFC